MITGLLCQSGTIVRMCHLCALAAAMIPNSRMSTSGRIRVPRRKRRSKRASGRYEDARARPRQHPARSRGAPTSVPGRRRWRGEIAVGHSETCSHLKACCSWLRFLRGGAQTRTGSNCFLWTGQPDSRGRVSHPPREPFDSQ